MISICVKEITQSEAGNYRMIEHIISLVRLAPGVGSQICTINYSTSEIKVFSRLSFSRVR